MILIIEDNTELRISLKKSLSKHYAIITAPNGEEGLKSANDLNPDLIVCDVMMPGINGFEVCQRIKNNVDTSHIPVILLTALSGTENQIEGYKTGADAYITKPFSEKLLLTQIENQLHTRQKLKEMFLSSDHLFKETLHTIPDLSIIEKASLIIEDNLLVPDFSVDHLADKMKMSRSSLHRKIRAHTDQSTTEFIRFIRLKKAVKILKSGNNNIEEISFMVGFNSPSYFSHCFKKQFGTSPKNFGINNE